MALRSQRSQSLTSSLLVAVMLPIVYLLAASNIAAAPARNSAEQRESKPAATAAKHHVIVIRQVTFEPKVLTVRVEDTIEWENKDIVAHTATSDRKSFDSGIIAPGATWTFTATRKGTYTYTCTLHPNMKGTLIVR